MKTVWVAVIGSRTFNDRPRMEERIRLLLEAKRRTGDRVGFVSGGAQGADQMAEEVAKDFGIPVKVYRPNYARDGKRAPLLRNHDIIGKASFVLAFWDGKSRGTGHAIEIARKAGKDVFVCRFEVEEEEP